MRIRLWEKFKGWRRGERMLPKVNRGRCFERINSPPPGGVIKVGSKPTISITSARIIRADGTIEDIK